MKYFFHLGNNKALSVAEILAKFNKPNILYYNKEALVVDIEQEFDAVRAIGGMGGVIKIGIVVKDNIRKNEIKNELEKLLPHKFEGKYIFGISDYTNKNLFKIGLGLKKELKNRNISARFVISKEKVLSSVVVTQNKILKKGNEFAVYEESGMFGIVNILAVQPFKELSKRDYGRPGRDDFSGMIPPKLAQMMINLSETKKDDVILDPFCGSGTIIAEAVLMGYKSIKGSDISSKAIGDTKKNLEWLKKINRRTNSNLESELFSDDIFDIFESDATQLSKKIHKNSIDAIITEPFLGPQRGRVNFDETRRALEKMYSKAIQEFHKVLKRNGTVVMIWPVFGKRKFLDIKIKDFKKINILPIDLNFSEQTQRQSVLYGRIGQKIWREVVVFKKS